VVDEEVAAEVHGTPSRGRFEYPELLEPKFAAKPCGMPPPGPAQIVGKDVAVLALDGGLVFRCANGGGAVPEAERRQAADVLARFERNSWKRNRELLRDIDVGIQIVAMGV